jgi:two-component system sensor histidine kinase RegB
MPRDSTPPLLGMVWLLRLRWAAVVGQAGTVVFVRAVLGVPVPVLELFALIAVTAVSNFRLCRRLIAENSVGRGKFERVLTLDTFTLTLQLLLSGGAGNPFGSFYLVHVAMAAVALGRMAAWRMVALSSVCLLLLFGMSKTVPIAPLSHELYVSGMLVAVVLAAIAIAFFAGHLHRALQKRESELATLRVAAEKSERFAALATLAAGVAHELGSPLGTIRLAARELERTLGRGNDELAADVSLIVAETERCRALLGRLNARSTAELGEAPVECSLQELFDAVRGLLAPALVSRLRIAELPRPGLFLPRSAVVEAVASLVRNAGDAASGEIGLSAELAGNDIRFCVRDSGPPIPKDVATHLGEPFFTTKEPGRGMGLGLYLIRLLAERLGGSMTISHDGHGTLAVLSLPLRVSLSA